MEQDTSSVRIGVIGTGGMGARHARNLHLRVPGASVTAVCDVDPERCRSAADECGGAAMYDGAPELIAAADVDAVVIASPDETHAPLVLACLEARKPVLCEKPLATTAADARQVVEAEAALGQKLVSVGFMRRFDPQHVAVKQLLAAQTIGRPLLFKGVHRNASLPPTLPPEIIIIGSAVHDLDSARWLLEAEIEDVYVRGMQTDASLPDGMLDLVLIQMALSGGRLGTIETFLSAHYGYEVTAEVVGELGTALTAPFQQATVRLDARHYAAVPPEWLTRFQEAYVAEVAAWVRALHGAAFDGADAWDGMASLFAAEACLRSLASGRPESVVLPPKPALYHRAAA